MKKCGYFSMVTSVFFLSIITVSVAVREYGFCSSTKRTLGKCRPDEFECLNGQCIGSARHCDGTRHCSDNSDENYCRSSYACPSSPRKFVKCSDSYKCIPQEWICNGYFNCPNRDDEKNCDYSTFRDYFMPSIKQDAIDWLLNKSVRNSATRKWGPFVQKTAVAFYLSDPKFLSNDSSVRKEITYELSIQLLSRINKKKIEGVSSNELASFLNAFLVTCTDPRDFHGYNLVEELRSRVDKQNFTNPYVLLALCNSGEAITEPDVKKLIEAFWINNREIWTDTQAIALMALSCARNQTGSTVDAETMNELSMELKQHQYRNGTVENLHTTLLVMQALYSAEPDEDPNNFDERKALTYILENQKEDGSFGNFLLTYYALPVLNCRSIVNISSTHCKTVHKDEETASYDLKNHHGRKIRVRYSVWFGVEKDIERTLSLRVPAKTSFYGVMEIAAEIDSKYRFDYVMKNRKPYITALFGVMDDPENEEFWFAYQVKDGKTILIQESTADITPKNDDHMIMWYRKGNWVE